LTVPTYVRGGNPITRYKRGSRARVRHRL